MPAGATNSLLSLIVLLAVGVGDLAWLNLVLAPQLDRNQVGTAAQPGVRGNPSASEASRTSGEKLATGRPGDRLRGVEPPPEQQQGEADAEPASAEPVPEDASAAEQEPPAEVAKKPDQASAKPVEASKPPVSAARQPLPKLADISFGTGSAGLRRSARVALRRVVKLMVAHKQARLVVRGHADERGREDYNHRLATWRAKTVLRYLIALGIPASRVSMESLGAREPADPADTPAAWAKNRRVQLVWQ